MDYRAFEQRLLDTIFTSDVQLNPATIAFLYKIPVQEASDLLQQAAVAGLLNIESDEEGNILYVYPNRVRLGAREGRDGAKRPPGVSPPGGEQGALVRVGAQGADTALSPRASTQPAPRPPVEEAVIQHIDMTEVATGSATHADAGAGSATGDKAQTMRCPFCSETIIVGAKKCKHCHEFLDYALRDLHAHKAATAAGQIGMSVALQPVVQAQQQQLAQWNSTTATQAAMLSFFVPGLGQMCSGRVPAGLLWMMFTCLGYLCFIVPGIVLHILCVINAARQPRQYP